jgi:hypothetical protein
LLSQELQIVEGNRQIEDLPRDIQPPISVRVQLLAFAHLRPRLHRRQGYPGHFHRQLRGITRFPLRHLRLLDPLPSPHCRVRAPLWRTPRPPTVREICDQALFLGKARTLQPTGTPGLKPRWRCRQARRGNPACHRPAVRNQLAGQRQITNDGADAAAERGAPRRSSVMEALRFGLHRAPDQFTDQIAIPEAAAQ